MPFSFRIEPVIQKKIKIKITTQLKVVYLGPSSESTFHFKTTNIQTQNLNCNFKTSKPKDIQTIANKYGNDLRKNTQHNSFKSSSLQIVNVLLVLIQNVFFWHLPFDI